MKVTMSAASDPLSSQPVPLDWKVIEPGTGLFPIGMGEVWRYRELLYFFIWRDVKVRYKQTALGALWVMLQPLCAMLIFTVVFGYFSRIPSDGLPYSIFAFTGLLPWTYFAQAVTRGGGSLVASSDLIRKVYFPRLIVPLAAVISPLVDFFISFLVMAALMVWFGIAPTPSLAALPLFILLSMMTALSVALWLSALNVKYRDVGHIIPFAVQLLMFASPVVYPASIVPDSWRFIYGLNPMVAVIEGFRWALLGKGSLDHAMLTMSAAVVAALTCLGVWYFKRAERTFADII
jgi:lipopolysaccharide transport system permease protein